ncbi:MAG: pantetheine-phosphate adenylyltransferase [Smithellaceae bacterium]|jgi:pantetheine-phosphate adenylyltransferase|nr:pantetheine-phosphate adenylyltransferase [Smithellaceae bacterium]MDD3259531.1 pantetheine-phosphate adenylyltransferase [Smithellaceae bacterium]MDD3849525.1 pantetheine-phosphate adenylyltransferase [Smithellaceae bacterium]HOG12816.1 pantetheine-phosphate adenylyltransferase [Smithellaceae bacterium]HOQ72566.1 pantetheine-phosphate adenylyltransferase [Smithellaceae bacterium]
MITEKTGGRVAIYPGSFDPITNGHVDIIKRGSRIFDKIIVLVAYNPRKSFLFTVEERCRLIREVFSDCEYVQVDSHDGLLIDYLQSSGASIIMRGMRALSDFEYEFQMALMNRRQTKNVETVFLMSGFRWFFTSSNIIKEVASLGGTVRGLVPDNVYQKLLEKYPNKNNRR